MIDISRTKNNFPAIENIVLLFVGGFIMHLLYVRKSKKV